MRSEPLTARTDQGACAGFGVANDRQAVGPEVRLGVYRSFCNVRKVS